MLNILICDDERDIVSALNIYLTAEGYHTLPAYNGREAVEIATAFAMGTPALLREGMTWRDLRLRALHATPVELRRVGSGVEA